MRKKLYQDGYNEIVLKPTTNKVIIGINVSSYFKSKFRSFKCKTEEQALKIGVDYVNKNSKVKINL